ncbi:hypothetical protein NS331_10955 [Pseudacidovorax intermedius]|uniref:Uncharacterized protein n=2 Tax=Pseudacidovorax intermedius TaxID=433924 RepID=A0A147GW35_9BURK|nr:hypothetical protein NS331_10955 [Pseudacidovorax intermedius]
MFLWHMQSSECASWVQAWGSIFAIIATVGVVALAHYLQRTAKKRDDHDAETRELEYGYQLAHGSARVAEKIPSFISDTGVSWLDGRAMLAEVTAYADAFSRFDASKMQSTRLFQAVLAADALTRLLQQQLEDLLAAKAEPAVTVKPIFNAALARAQRRPGAVRDLIEQIAQELSSHARTIGSVLDDRKVKPESKRLVGDVILRALSDITTPFLR